MSSTILITLDPTMPPWYNSSNRIIVLGDAYGSAR